MVLGIIAFAISFSGNVGLHETPRRMARKVLTNWLVFLGILGSFGVVTGYAASFTRPLLVTWAVVTPLVQMASHFLLRWGVPKVITMGGHQRRVVIAGVNEVGLQLLRQFENNPYLNTRVMGFFDDRNSDRMRELGSRPMLGPMSGLVEFCKATMWMRST